MNNKIANIRIISRNDISSNWEKENPILFQGEIGIEGKDLPLSVTYDKIALGSLEEFGLTNFNDVTPGQGTQYPIVTDDESRKFPEIAEVDIPTYWTRTTGNGNVHQWYFIDMDGRRATGGGANYNRIAILLSI